MIKFFHLIFISLAPLQFILFLPGCGIYSSEEKKISEIQEKSHTAKIYFDSIRIFIPYKEKEMSNFAMHFLEHDSAFIASGGCPDPVMHIWDLSNPQKSYNLPMPQAVNWCGDYTVFFKNLDSIYLLTAKGNFMLVANNKVDTICNVSELINKDGLWVKQYLKPFELFVPNDSLLYFCVEGGVFPKGEWAYKTYNYPVTVKMNYRTKQIKYIGTVYPKKLERGYPAMANIFQHFYNNKLFYTFHVIPQIWEYDFKRDTMIIHSVRSKYQTAEFKPIEKKHPDRDEVTENMRRSGQYLEYFFYDPYKKLYYLFYQLPLAEKNETGYFNTFKDIRISIMVLDEHFNIVAEELLPKECFYVFYTALSKDGLYINYGPVNDEQKEGVKLLKISVNR